MSCLNCGAALKKRQKKFCSCQCMNTYNAVILRKQHKEEHPDRWRVCDECGEHKNINQFSLLDKTRMRTTERKTTCKTCSAKIRAKNRRDRTWKDDAIKVLFNNAKARAKRRGMEFSIRKEDIIIPDVCPVFGIPLKREQKDTWMNAPSIDRINNDRGYTTDNIIIVSRRANILKKDASLGELQMLTTFYTSLLVGT